GARRRGLLLMLVSTAVLISALSSIEISAALEGRGHPGALGVILVGLLAIPSLWMASTNLMASRSETGLYGVLVLLSLSGAFMALNSNQIGVTWLGLELMGLSSVLLMGFDQRDPRRDEATLKAFLGGSFSSALLLFGFGLLFGATGRLDYEGLQSAIRIQSPIDAAGLTLVLGGGLLKCGVAPFHQWAPDVDEGSSVAVMAFRSVCLRTAMMLVLLRLVTEVFPPDLGSLSWVFVALAIGGSFMGSFMAAAQSEMKRMLSWGIVAHGGNLLLAFAANTASAYAAMVFSLFATGIATLGALCVLSTLKEGTREMGGIKELSGLAYRRPMPAVLLTLFLMSLAGLPVTAGFWAKWLLVRSVIGFEAGWPALVILVSSAVLLYAYFRWLAALFMQLPQISIRSEASSSELAILALCAGVTIWLGMIPDPVIGPAGERLLEVLKMATPNPS
ncbi:NADH-quinone oxidoreductase subunit N, partial [Myxococcota bacterium]|nr:NADH-quinone oxidoreductase subunit N [Myxococcota bacterium]